MRKSRILIIDDDVKFTARLKSELMQTGNCEVREEHEGRKAVLAAIQFKPDLILLDLLLPDMDGPDVIAELKETEELKKIPIVLISVVATKQEVKMRGGVLGGYPFIAKPVKLHEVVEYLEGS